MRWHIAAIAIGWLLAAVAIWEAGQWAERVHRYDECTLATLGPEAFWACPAQVRIRQPALPQPVEEAPA